MTTTIAQSTTTYELAGQAGAPLIVVLGGISATRHATAWWSDIVGDAKPIDTTRYRVLGVDFIDGGRRADGQPRRVVTTHDQADAIAAVLDEIGVARVHAFVGASYGGMVGLAFAERYQERIERLVAISAPHEPHPMSTALRALQRRIVKLGLETGRTRSALAIARGVAMTTYRSREEFGERFDPRPDSLYDNDATFPVESYLAHHGEQFADRWSAERFLALSLSGDLHRVDPARITTPTVIVAAEGDAIVPGAQLEALAATIAAPTRLIHLASTCGHDAFLTEPDALGTILEIAIATTIIQ
ncbi:MAG TPA: homoserine O-succinyltransferase [Gemmatimonadaceae bacterium]|nr:homoserine O-succinyltransferase [Gemmatimonadaceae bacterium]